MQLIDGTPVLVLWAIVTASSGCDPYFEICGNVKRCSDNAPLVGVHVVARYSDGTEMMSGYTDPTGRYCDSQMGSTEPPDPYDVDYDKSGFTKEHQTVRGGAKEMPEICLMANACSPGDSGCGSVDAGSDQ